MQLIDQTHPLADFPVLIEWSTGTYQDACFVFDVLFGCSAIEPPRSRELIAALDPSDAAHLWLKVSAHDVARAQHTIKIGDRVVAWISNVELERSSY